MRMIFTAEGRIPYFQNECLDPFTRFMAFARDLLAARHDPFVAAQRDNHAAALEPRDGAGDDRADPVLVFFVNAAAFILTDQLNHHLLDGLGTDASHHLDIQRRPRCDRPKDLH